MADDGYRDDNLWYGPRYAESVDDALAVIAGRILRDLIEDRERGTLPSNARFVIAPLSNTITVTVFMTPAVKDAPEFTDDMARARVKTVASRYDWRGKANDNERRFYLRCTVKVVRTSLEGLITGALLG